MEFNPGNEVVKLCAEGMSMEAGGEVEEASKLFVKAWDEPITDFEKFTSAHYVARHQDTVAEKLKWDEVALSYALKLDDDSAKGVLPSLYLNIGKCYEDLKDIKNASIFYYAASSFTKYLPNDGYGKLIKNGIENGIKRVNNI